LGSLLKILPYGYLIKKIHFYSMRKNSHGRILREEPKEQHLSTVPKSFPTEKLMYPCYDLIW